MGTLFNQQPRTEHITHERTIRIGKEIKEIAKELEISFTEALNLYMSIMKSDDYDIKDEQLAGFGELLKKLVNEISGIPMSLDNISEALSNFNDKED